MKHVVSVSSGLGSAYAWKLVCDRHGPENVVGVFTDVNGEHPDNYRFLAEVQYRLGSRLVKLTNDGRTIWDVMIESRFLANTRVDTCSRILKREAIHRWLKENCDPADTTIYLGLDWTEMHRFDRAKPLWAKAGWTIAAPLCEPPYIHKSEAQAWLDEVGIKRPALYDMGMTHSNCGGGCVKAGIKQFKHLLAVDRWWYVNWWEAGEERVRQFLGRDDIAILRDRRRVPKLVTECPHMVTDPDEDDDWEYPEHEVGECPAPKTLTRMVDNTRPFTLRELREEIEAAPQMDLFTDEPDEAGCGVCFVGLVDEEPTEEVA